MTRAIIPEPLTRVRVHQRAADQVEVDFFQPGRPGRDDLHRGYVLTEAQAVALRDELNAKFPEGE